MISEILNLWSNGAVTLPKAWRERYKTKHFMARENERGNLEIIPVVDCEYYEESEESFGLRFPTGIEAGELLDVIDQAEKEINRNQNK